ncbi:MAG: DotA/TraY family protein, partial [Methylobacter sp.]
AEVAQAEIDSANVVGADRAPTETYYQLMEWFRVEQQKAAQNIATTAMADVTSTLKEATKREGWMTAGFYFLGLGNFQQVINRTINMSWISSESVTEKDVIDHIADETYHASAASDWRLMESYISTGHKQMKAGRILPETVATFGDSSTSFMQMFGKKLNDQMVNSINNNATPLATAADLGASLTTIGWEILIGGGIAKLGSFIPGIGGAIVGAASSVLVCVGITALFLGVVLTLICLLPAFFWGRRVLAWIIRVTVAQVGGPAWMVLHVHHAGDGLTGNAGGGYMLALSLVMSPVLDIVGLAIAFLLMVVISPVITSTIMPNVTAQGSGTAALFAVFITAIVNGGVIFALLELISRIEHEVMAFVGGRGSDMNLDGDGDKNRMFALMTMASRKIPGANLPSLSGGKSNNNSVGKGDGATISGAGKNRPGNLPKITNDHLMPKDK